MVISKFEYGIELYAAQNVDVKERLFTSIMKYNKIIYAKPTYLVRHDHICETISTQMPEQLMYGKLMKFLHKLSRQDKPAQISGYFTKPRSVRLQSKLVPTENPSSEKRIRNIIFRGPKIYNKLPEYYRNMKLSIFKNKIKDIKIKENKDGPTIFERHKIIVRQKEKVEWIKI